MESATGASRGELLEWINTTLHTNLHKIEETASGKDSIEVLSFRCSGVANYQDPLSR